MAKNVTPVGPGGSADDIQVENPQRTIRGESVDSTERAGRFSWGESKLVRWAERRQADILSSVVSKRTPSVEQLSVAHSELQGFLVGVMATTVGEPGLQNRVAREHALDATVRDADGSHRLARRGWVAPGMRWAVVSTLALADLFFFWQLWRDIEDASSWWSVESLQALLYAVITPIVTALLAGILGRAVAARVHSGDAWSSSHARRAAIVGLPAGLILLVVWFAVDQRLDMLAGLVGAAPVSRPMTFLIFALLTLGLFVCEIFVHDEESTLHTLRTQDKAGTDAEVQQVIATASALHATVVRHHLALQALLSTTLLELPEPISAFLDVAATEWSRGDAFGDWAVALPASTDVHLPATAMTSSASHTPGVGPWLELEGLEDRLDQMAQGGPVPVDLSEIAAIQRALVGFAPPRIETVLATVTRALGVGSLEQGTDGGLVLATVWQSDEPAVAVAKPQLHAVDQEEPA